MVPVRLIAEKHIIEDMGWIPSVYDWAILIKPTKWTMRGYKNVGKHEITNVLRALHTQGITKVEIDYSGGGDEGTFENSKFYNQDNKEVSVDWNKTLDLSEDETFDIDDFEGLIYGDQGRLNQWYSFAGDYSCKWYSYY